MTTIPKTIDELRAVPLPTSEESLRKKADDMAYCYGIRFFIRDGHIWQSGGGIEIMPRKGALPNWNDQGTPGKTLP